MSMIDDTSLKKPSRLVCFLCVIAVKSMTLCGNSAWAKAGDDVVDRIGQCELVSSEEEKGAVEYDEIDSKKIDSIPISTLNVVKAGSVLKKELSRYSIHVDKNQLLNMLTDIPLDPAIMDELYGSDLSFTDLLTGLESEPVYRPKLIKIDGEAISEIGRKKALKMLERRYRQAKTLEKAILTEYEIHKIAEQEFRTFMRDNFHKYDFADMGVSWIRFYFMGTYKNIVMQTFETVDYAQAKSMISKGHFKDIKLDSELLKEEGDIESQAKLHENAKYAFLRNISVSYKMREDRKPEYNLLTLHPLYSSDKRKHNVFGQLSGNFEGERKTGSLGFGYRHKPKDAKFVVGANAFMDVQQPHNFSRASFGLDVQTSLWGGSANIYKGLSSWSETPVGFNDESLDGYDIEFVGRAPFLPALELSGRGYHWSSRTDDIDGVDIRLEYSPIPAITIAGGMNDESNQDTSYEIGVRYNHVFSAPPTYLYNWNEQFRQKSVEEYIFRRVNREDDILTK